MESIKRKSLVKCRVMNGDNTRIRGGEQWVKMLDGIQAPVSCLNSKTLAEEMEAN